MGLRFVMCAVLVLLVACGNPDPVEIHGNTMGTTYSIKVLEPVDSEQLKTSVEARLARINQLMSTYIPNSEISLINGLPVGESMSISDENLKLLQFASQLNAYSAGKFDVTVAPLVSLWGFGPDPRLSEVPDPAALQQAMRLLGLDGLQIEEQQLVKHQSTQLDFSSIAKGYGVDELSKLVESFGGENYLVEIGGELRAKGVNARGQVWRIGIETPDDMQRVPFTSVPLKNLAMATSGDYRNYFEVDGKRFSHTIDPTTGYPITHNVASVTVLADTAMEADGYATAINVMGESSGMQLAEQQKLAVFVIIKGDAGFETRTSPAFDAYMSQR